MRILQKMFTFQMQSLPVVHEGNPPDHSPRDKFLLQSFQGTGMEDELNELSRKLQLIEKLITEYNALSEKEKTKVQSIHDYMAS